MTAHPYQLLSLTLMVMLSSLGVSGFSMAAFTSSSNNTGSVTAALDWTPPTVSMTSPGASVVGTVTLNASASDAESGVASVVIQYAPTGTGAWTTICTKTATPYSCSWNTTAVADAKYDLRARATDNAGYSATSSLVTTTVANTVRAILSVPSQVLRGTVPLSVTLQNASTASSIRIERRLVGSSGSWTTICSTINAASLSCSWNTTAVATDFWDLRAVAVISGTTYTDTVADVLVDNVAPTVSMTDPGNPLSGNKTFAATANDDDSGIAQVALQYAPAGTGSWTTMCTPTESPYSCRFNTTSIANGDYDFRAVATDVAGNSTTSSSLRRTVNNAVASVSMEDPGAFLSGAVNLTATASSPQGVASVLIQRATNGSSTWVDVCTDTTSPYSCSWNSTTVEDGLYDFRAVMTDGVGGKLTSDVVSARRVDNSPVRAVDVQSINGGPQIGRLDPGDQLVLTFSERISTTSVLTGWNGGGQNVTVRAVDGTVLGLSGNDDTLSVETSSGGAVNLGSVNLRQSYVKKGKTVLFTNSSMVATTEVVTGLQRTVVTVTLGTPSQSPWLNSSPNVGTMVWTPSTKVVDLVGRPCAATPVTETGTADRDF